MKLNRKQFLEALYDVLATELDPFMVAHGFARAKKSNAYRRDCADGRQEVSIDTIFRPAYCLEATAHIYPWLRLSFPEVNRITSEMTDDQLAAVNASDVTVAEPMDIVVPKESHVRWFVYEKTEDVVLCVQSIQGYIEKWTMPFLDEVGTVEALTHCYEVNDERILASRTLFLHMAAAYIVLGQPAKATGVLEDKLGKAGPRRDFSKAFEYVQMRLP